MDLAAVFEEWAPRLLAYMITITRDRQKGEDALQNLFLNLARSGSGAVDRPAYLFRAARNEAVRLAKRKPDRPLRDLEILVSKDPEEAATVGEELDRLPPEQAEVVILHVLQGLTFAEVAEITGMPPDTAASRYRYAAEKLRERLA